MAKKQRRVASEVLSVTVAKGMTQKIDEVASEMGVTRSKAVQHALLWWPRMTQRQRDAKEDAGRGSAPSPGGRKKKAKKKSEARG